MIRVGTYNVHGFVGRDGRRNLPRVARVINDLDCRVIGLQEVDSRGAATTLAELEDRTRLRPLPGVTISSPDGDFGNLVLTDLTVRNLDHHDLSVSHREPRGAVETTLDRPDGGILTMIATHLGLRRRERWRQTQKLLRICRRVASDSILVLVGDFNEWWPSARSLRALHRELGPSRSGPSFPASRPFLTLDRIWVRPFTTVRSLRVIDTTLTRVASDHRPVVAELTLPPMR